MPLKGHLVEGSVAAVAAAVGALTMGTAWMSTSVCLPVGWVILGPITLLFVPALAIVTAISKRLGVQIEVKES